MKSFLYPGSPKVLFTSILFLLVSAICVRAQNTVTFFIPLPEGDVRNTLEALNSATGNTITTTISLVTVEGNAVIVIDHWEDGYEADIDNPVQASTLVFGDLNFGNGDLGAPPTGLTCFPVCPLGDMPLPAGHILTLKNTMNASPTRGNSPVLFDGKDRISSNRALSVVRAAWSPTPGVVLAEAVEVVDTSAYGLNYVAPVGQNTAGQNAMFERTEFYIQAAQDNTQLTIDVNGPGSPGGITNVTINQGQSHTVTGVLEGATVSATKPVQVHLLTGDVGASYESRWYTLYPVDFADMVYYNPVASASSGDPSSVFIYNPTGSSITVNYNTTSGSGSFMVPAMQSYRFNMPTNSGAKFSSTANFFALVAVDSDASNNQTHDWGYALLPENYLTSMAVVGWGPGADDLSGPAGPDANYSPVWVMAPTPTTLYLDWDGDPSTGPLTDPNGNKYDQNFSLSAYQSLKLYDTVNADNDQTGARIYTVDGTKIAVAWGQDPSTAVAGNPALDIGTAVSPSLVLDAYKTADIVDLDNDGLLDDGEVITYRIVVQNLSQRNASVVDVDDIIPANTAYVPGSTVRHSSNPLYDNIPIPDNANPTTLFPLDEGGVILMNLGGGQIDTLEFQMQANLGVPPYPSEIINSASIIQNGNMFFPEVEVPVDNNFTGCVLGFFTDNTYGTPATAYLENGTLFIEADIPYLLNGGTVQAEVDNAGNGDQETIVLTETPPASGIYRGSLPTSISSGGAQEDGTLLALAGHSITASYTNNTYNNTCDDMVTMIVPSESKQLYLSDSLSVDGMDRILPWDGTAASSALLSVGGGGGTCGPPVVSNTSSNSTTSSSSTYSVSHQTLAGDNRLMLVGISYRDNGSNTRQVNTVTYGAQNLTLVSLLRNSSGSDDVVTELWSLVAPAVGTANVTATWNETFTSKVMGVITFTNVDQTTPLGTEQTATGSGAAPSLVVSSATNELVFDVVSWGNNNGVSPGSGQSEEWEEQEDPDGNASDLTGAASTEAGAASVTMSWSDENVNWAQIAVAIKPFSGASLCPVAVANTSVESSTSDSDDITVSHTTQAGDNRLMLVGISYRDNGDNNREVNTVTYGAQNLSLVSLLRNSSGSNDVVTELWSLVAPAVGTADVTVTWNQSFSSKVVGVATFDHVDQTTPLGTAQTNTGDEDASVVVSSAANELVFDVISWGNNESVAAGAGQTERWEEDPNPGGGIRRHDRRLQHGARRCLSDHELV